MLEEDGVWVLNACIQSIDDLRVLAIMADQSRGGRDDKNLVYILKMVLLYTVLSCVL